MAAMTQPDPAGAADRLLVVEDDLALREVLARGLREEGFAVVTARDGGTAMALADGTFAALVLDIGLPDTDGRDLCQALRARGVRAPVLFLTAADRLTDRLAGFAAGGDDYLVKPFHLAELVARLRALVRRGASGAVPKADVHLDPAGHSLVRGTAALPLTPTEFRLLAALMAAPGTVLRRRELVRVGWSDGSRVNDNTLDQYIGSGKEELMNYLAEWCDVKQADLEGVITDLTNHAYNHQDCNETVVKMYAFTKLISLLFQNLSKLDYIGKRRDANIFVKEEMVMVGDATPAEAKVKKRSSFLAD